MPSINPIQTFQIGDLPEDPNLPQEECQTYPIFDVENQCVDTEQEVDFTAKIKVVTTVELCGVKLFAESHCMANQYPIGRTDGHKSGGQSGGHQSGGQSGGHKQRYIQQKQ